jgi:AcrR family transcriptional regulator
MSAHSGYGESYWMPRSAAEPLSSHSTRPRRGARDRVLEAAYDLFRLQGTSNVGIDAIVERSGVAKMSLYRHFHSKKDLIDAFLKRREELWTTGWLKSEVCRRAENPSERLLGIFELFDEWFNSGEFDGCSFINVLLEYPSGDQSRATAGDRLAEIRVFLKGLATDAGVKDADSFADTWHILMKGAIVAACEGNRRAAAQAQVAAKLLLKDALARQEPHGRHRGNR